MAMTSLTIDTHVWVWAAFESVRIHPSAREAIREARRLLVPSVCVYEIGQKVRVDRWPGMNRERLDEIMDTSDQPIEIVPLTPEIARRASLMDWPHRDPIDRIIAATALELGTPLISRDPVFDVVSELARRWADA